jgi:IS5 family transposase
MTTSQTTFADAELRAKVVLTGVLKGISEFIDSAPDLMTRVHEDLRRGLKRPHGGRNGMTPSRVVRSFVLCRVKNWSLRELSERINDGLTLRLFTDFGTDLVPTYRTFNGAFNRLQKGTIRDLNDIIVRAAVEVGLEDGNRLRVDTSVVETDVHFPTDSSLLWDAVRVITRLCHRLQERVSLPSVLPTRTRRARRIFLKISRMTSRQRSHSMKRKYVELLGVAEEVIQKARAVAVGATPRLKNLDPIEGAVARSLIMEIQKFCERGDRVVSQTRRRVLENETVPVADKIVSIFEPHTDIILRGKRDKPFECGHKIFLAESGAGLITEYRVLDGNPSDEKQVASSLEHHKEFFGKVPHTYAADRGFYSAENVAHFRVEGVTGECIPVCGGLITPERKAYERTKDFKKGQSFRAGIEGTLSVLFRGRGMKRCRSNGRDRFEVFVGVAVLANNLMRIAALLDKRTAKPRRRAVA